MFLPYSIILLGILMACRRCILVQEGHKYFDLMRGRPQFSHNLSIWSHGSSLCSNVSSWQGLCHDWINVNGAKCDQTEDILSACRTYKNKTGWSWSCHFKYIVSEVEIMTNQLQICSPIYMFTKSLSHYSGYTHHLSVLFYLSRLLKS